MIMHSAMNGETNTDNIFCMDMLRKKVVNKVLCQWAIQYPSCECKWGHKMQGVPQLLIEWVRIRI